MAYALSLSGLLTTFRHHFVQRPHAQCKFNCFNPTARACYVTFARQCNTTMYMRLCNGGLHLSGKGAAVFAEGLSGAVASGLGKVRYLN